jgi:hypothetical protein
MVISHEPDRGEACDDLQFGRRVGRTTHHTIADERKEIEKIANGREVFSHWESVTEKSHSNIKRYIVFKGMFRRGEYCGRASTYHHWAIADNNMEGE